MGEIDNPPNRVNAAVIPPKMQIWEWLLLILGLAIFLALNIHSAAEVCRLCAFDWRTTASDPGPV